MPAQLSPSHPASASPRPRSPSSPPWMPSPPNQNLRRDPMIDEKNTSLGSYGEGCELCLILFVSFSVLSWKRKRKTSFSDFRGTFVISVDVVVITYLVGFPCFGKYLRKLFYSINFVIWLFNVTCHVILFHYFPEKLAMHNFTMILHWTRIHHIHH